MNLAQKNAAVIYLFNNNIVSGAVSEGMRRDEYRLHTIYAVPEDGGAEDVKITLEVCGRSPKDERDWVVLQAATSVPFHLVLPEGYYFALRAKRNATTRPVTVMVNSGGHTRT